MSGETAKKLLHIILDPATAGPSRLVGASNMLSSLQREEEPMPKANRKMIHRDYK